MRRTTRVHALHVSFRSSHPSCRSVRGRRRADDPGRRLSAVLTRRLPGERHDGTGAAETVGRGPAGAAAGARPVHLPFALQHERRPDHQRHRLRRRRLRRRGGVFLLAQHQQPRRQQPDADVPRPEPLTRRTRPLAVQLRQDHRPGRQSRAAVRPCRPSQLAQHRGLVLEHDQTDQDLRRLQLPHAALRRQHPPVRDRVRRRPPVRRRQDRLADAQQRRRQGALRHPAHQHHLRDARLRRLPRGHRGLPVLPEDRRLQRVQRRQERPLAHEPGGRRLQVRPGDAHLQPGHRDRASGLGPGRRRRPRRHGL